MSGILSNVAILGELHVPDGWLSTNKNRVFLVSMTSLLISANQKQAPYICLFKYVHTMFVLVGDVRAGLRAVRVLHGPRGQGVRRLGRSSTMVLILDGK